MAGIRVFRGVRLPGCGAAPDVSQCGFSAARAGAMTVSALLQPGQGGTRLEGILQAYLNGGAGNPGECA